MTSKYTRKENKKVCVGLVEFRNALAPEKCELKKGTMGWLAEFSEEAVGYGVNWQRIPSGPSVQN